MENQPLGATGGEVDIVTGRPFVRKTVQEREAELELKEKQAIAEAAQVANAMPAIMPVMASLLEARMWDLMQSDMECKIILKNAKAFGLKLDLVPMTIKKLRRQAFGAALCSLTDETQVAPVGIPTGE